MRKVKVFYGKVYCGILIEEEKNKKYTFQYNEQYSGAPISLSMPVKKKVFEFVSFPPFFDGLLPEGIMLESLLKTAKIDKDDCLSQLILIGKDLSGNVTVEEFHE